MTPNRPKSVRENFQETVEKAGTTDKARGDKVRELLRELVSTGVSIPPPSPAPVFQSPKLPPRKYLAKAGFLHKLKPGAGANKNPNSPGVNKRNGKSPLPKKTSVPEAKKAKLDPG